MISRNPCGTVYCFDTGAFIKAWRENYPIDTFPSLWQKFDHMIDSGALISVDAVFQEIKKKEDDLYKWAKDRKAIFIQHIPEIQKNAVEILRVVPDLYEADKDRSGADPFVIATAKYTGAIVVSNEKVKAKRKSVTIHQACNKFSIQSMNLVEMIKCQNWRF